MRNKLSLLVVFAAALWLARSRIAAAQPLQSEPPTHLHRISDDVYVIENQVADVDSIRQYGGNVLLFLTPDGVIQVDCKFETMHDDIVAKVKSLTDKPIQYVILTHNHADHAGGAEKMSASGAKVVISVDDLENMARAPNQKWLPEVAYSGRAELRLGGKEIELYEVRGHTRGDTLVYIPSEKIVETGDLFATDPKLPFIVDYSSGGSWTDLTNEVDDLLKLDFNLAIPGHGLPITRKDVVAIRDRMVAIRERFRELNRQNKSADEIRQTLMKEMNWGQEPVSMSISGMMQELR